MNTIKIAEEEERRMSKQFDIGDVVLQGMQKTKSNLIEKTPPLGLSIVKEKEEIFSSHSSFCSDSS